MPSYSWPPKSTIRRSKSSETTVALVVNVTLIDNIWLPGHPKVATFGGQCCRPDSSFYKAGTSLMFNSPHQDTSNLDTNIPFTRTQLYTDLILRTQLHGLFDSSQSQEFHASKVHILTMFSITKKAISKFRPSPYFSPFRLFGFCDTTERASNFKRLVIREPSYRPLPRPAPRKKCYPPGDPRYVKAKVPPIPRRRSSQRLGVKPLRQQRSVRTRSYHNLSKAGPCNAAQPKAQPNPQPPVIPAPAFDFDDMTQNVRRVAVHVAPHLTSDDKIFMAQLEKLNINHNMAEVLNGLETERANVERAEREAPTLEAERKARNAPYQDRRKIDDKFIIDWYTEKAKKKQDKEDVLARIAEAQKEKMEMEARMDAQRAEKIRIQYEALVAEVQREREETRKRREEYRKRRAKEMEPIFRITEENHKRLLAAQKAREVRAEAEAARLRAEREAAEAEAEVARLLAEREAAEAEARAQEEARKKAELEAQQAREELERQAHEARMREEEARRRAALEAQAREEQARRYAEELARMQQQIEAHQARDPRLWRDVSMQDVSSGSGPSAPDVSMAEEEPAPTPPPTQPTDADRWNLYEWKWDALKGDVGLLVFSQLPWPVLHDVNSVHDLTPERFSEFLFSAKRPGYEAKTKKERVKNELLRFHPDKYDGKILGKVCVEDHALVKEAVGRVTRFLTTARS
ncbi:hypothetical protein K443DRAFT_175423 [Laccaria amethystina LaAM-08-1]|uniref:Uncharacterized protein n=1 Tax=Laccaria amethystina LaAM-08-1 TaxID=1095629 RepID=A0A0C9XP23_9AGAR|nr:hypothetical protein K443DRAFT_175423 [Laccaria amethystina LaAM-08-1]